MIPGLKVSAYMPCDEQVSDSVLGQILLGGKELKHWRVSPL